jgi:hypothetical protein
MDEEPSEQAEPEEKPSTSALALMGPDILILPVTRPLGAPERSIPEAEIERLGPEVAHQRSLLDRLLHRNS